MIGQKKLKKFTKIEVAYEDLPTELKNFEKDSTGPYGGVRCDNCVYWKENNQCLVVKGNIESSASCILFAYEGGKLNLDFSSGIECFQKLSVEHKKLTKIEAGYMLPFPSNSNLRLNNKPSFGCHSCYYYVKKSKGCRIVKSPVSEYACCNLWSWEEIEQPPAFISGEKFKTVIM